MEQGMEFKSVDTEYCVCGYTVTDDDIITEVVGRTDANGITELYFLNEPYGACAIFNLKGIVVSPVHSDKSGIDRELQDILMSERRNAKKGVILLEDGLLTIENLFPFKAEVQGFTVDEGTKVYEFPDEVDVNPDIGELLDDVDFLHILSVLGVDVV